MCEHEEGGEQRQVLPFIFSSSGQVFVECLLCARHTLRRSSEQDGHGPCPRGAHGQSVESILSMLLWQANGLFNCCLLFI